MESMGKLILTGTIGQYNKLVGHVSSGDSLQGSLGGNVAISGNLAIGTVLETEVNTFVIVDADGNEIPAVLVDEEVVVSASSNDIRKGITAITSDGVIIGTKEIPSYYTAEGYKAITKGSRFTIPHADYDYTKLQVVICSFDTNFTKSVGAIKVALENSVYDVNSTTPLSQVTIDNTNKRIDLGITNDTDSICVVRYFMYKEIY